MGTRGRHHTEVSVTSTLNCFKTRANCGIQIEYLQCVRQKFRRLWHMASPMAISSTVPYPTRISDKGSSARLHRLPQNSPSRHPPTPSSNLVHLSLSSKGAIRGRHQPHPATWHEWAINPCTAPITQQSIHSCSARTASSPFSKQWPVGPCLAFTESGGALVKRKGARPLTSSAAMPANAQDYTKRLAEVTESKGDTEASFEWHRAW